LRGVNQFPLFLHLDGPALESAVTADSFSASLTHSSVFLTRSSPVWAVNLDMEITELDIRYTRLITDGLEAGVRVPVLDFGSGVLDDPLAWYHRTFGFPDYGRSGRPENDFLYEVRKNNVLVVKGKDGRIGIGDVRVSAKKTLFTGGPLVSLQATLELPTGSASTGHGSGGFDAGLCLLAETRLGRDFNSYSTAGVIFPGKMKARQSVALRTSFYAGAGVEALLFEHFSLLGQVMFQTSPFPETDIGQVDRISALLSVGGRYERGGRGLEFSVTEDPNTAGAPDVAFNLTFRGSF
jgi:hypothetical protein